MICYCKYSFNIGASFFLKGKEYYYDTSYHLQEFENCTIQTKIYHVYFTPDYDIPFIFVGGSKSIKSSTL
jgi:hypothetical protein